MAKNVHEIRDPIHVFIRLDSDERKVLGSWPFQRLRHIHQLALSHLVYPSATHKRFEHSLGVMELAGRVFDVVTHSDNLTDDIRDQLPEISQTDKKTYWKRVLRMAALCHDIGHLPFSHAAEKELLPEGWDHERITRELILSDEMVQIWGQVTPPLRPEDVAKIAVGPSKYPQIKFSTWETLLSEIITGDAFGVDRIDYLLRDSHHAGVAYGRFDHFRLIDTLRILPTANPNGGALPEPSLGVQEGGIHSAEALLLARYFMYTQVYLHPIRRIYDIHLKDFLTRWLPEGRFSTHLEDHLQMTDNHVVVELLKAAMSPDHPAHEPARRIVQRQHFKVLYERHPADVQVNREAASRIYEAARQAFGNDIVRFDHYTQKGASPDFPVLTRDGRIDSSLSVSSTLANLPVYAIDFVFIIPDRLQEAEQWLYRNRNNIIKPPGEGAV